MNAGPHRRSAQIYQFPAGGRAALGEPCSGATSSIDQYTLHGNEALCSGSWYHEEAICESQPDFKSSWER